MARRISEDETGLAPKEFTPVKDKDHVSLRYNCELITPMAGGGTKSWQPDLANPVRSQAVKGQLRFWWRTMQQYSNPEDLKQEEDRIWGCTDSAGAVRLAVQLSNKLTRNDLLTIEKNDKGYLQFNDAQVPAYVLFPLQGSELEAYELIQTLQFQLTVLCADSTVQKEIENTIKLWLLFGGLGARTRRGCGSLYCEQIMTEFQNGEDINRFIKKVFPGSAPERCTSPYPVLGNSVFTFLQRDNQHNPAAEWCAFLDSYGKFRQGPGVGRNPGQGNRPGRTRWPEADGIRRITGQANALHQPEHPAGNWFPRGAYGLPIQTEFRGSQGDPSGKIFLQPVNAERWPSPVILKVIKLNATTVLRVCLVLNNAVPGKLELVGGRVPHQLAKNELPMSYQNKNMPENAHMLHSGENPYTALSRHLNLTEVQ